METNDENLPKENSIDEVNENSENELKMESIASKKIRFFNSLIDLGIIYLFGQFFMFKNEMTIIWLGPFIFIYYFIFELIFGVTLGKMITKTMVTDVFGNRPTFFSIFIRSLARLIPFEAFSFLSTTGRGWHDYFSGTYVIYK